MKKQNNTYLSSSFKVMFELSKTNPLLCKFITRTVQLFYFIFDGIWLLFCSKKHITPLKKQILVINMYNFGDIIIFLDLAQKLRNFYPQEEYEISLVCQNNFVELIEYQKIFDRVYGINASKHMSNIKYRLNNYRNLKKYKYEDIILPRGFVSKMGSDILLNRVLDGDRKITIFEGNEKKYSKINRFYKRQFQKIYFLDDKKIKMQIEIHNELINRLSGKKNALKLPELKQYDYKINEEYYIIFPSSSTINRLWDIEKYAEIAKRVYEKTKYKVLLCGTANDLEIINQFKEKTKGIPYLDFVSKLSMMELIETVRTAKFVITNDTSIYHIALAVKTNVVVIAPSAHFSRFVKYGKDLASGFICDYVIKNMDCKDCDYKCTKRDKKDKHWPCLYSITVNDAWPIIEKMIDKVTLENYNKKLHKEGKNK